MTTEAPVDTRHPAQAALRRAFDALSEARATLAMRGHRDGEMWHLLLKARMAVSVAMELMPCPDPHRDVLANGELSAPWCDCTPACAVADPETRVLS